MLLRVPRYVTTRISENSQAWLGHAFVDSSLGAAHEAPVDGAVDRGSGESEAKIRPEALYHVAPVVVRVVLVCCDKPGGVASLGGADGCRMATRSLK